MKQFKWNNPQKATQLKADEIIAFGGKQYGRTIRNFYKQPVINIYPVGFTLLEDDKLTAKGHVFWGEKPILRLTSRDARFEKLYKEFNSENFQKNIPDLLDEIWSQLDISTKHTIEQIQLEAVRVNGDCIRFIKNPSEQVQLEAVNKMDLFSDISIILLNKSD